VTLSKACRGFALFLEDRQFPLSDGITGLPQRICVQLVYKNAVLKGLKLDLSNAESTTDSWATGSPCGSAELTRVWEANFAVKLSRING